MHAGNVLFKLFEFFKIHLKYIFIIGVFAPMSQNIMSPMTDVNDITAKEMASLDELLVEQETNHWL
jgi:hypothetical protein